MFRPVFLIIVSLLIVSAGMIPSAREHGMRLPNNWRVLQMQKHVADFVRPIVPVSVAAIAG